MENLLRISINGEMSAFNSPMNELRVVCNREKSTLEGGGINEDRGRVWRGAGLTAEA